MNEQQIAESLEYAVAQRLLVAVGAEPHEMTALRKQYGRREMIVEMIKKGGGKPWAKNVLLTLRRSTPVPFVFLHRAALPSSSPPSSTETTKSSPDSSTSASVPRVTNGSQ